MIASDRPALRHSAGAWELVKNVLSWAVARLGLDGPGEHVSSGTPPSVTASNTELELMAGVRF